jgi:predicted DCC family thiol-disulfide oxidoreductase YuxK
MSEPAANPLGWVLYDGSCGFCRSWVVYWAGTLRRRGFGIAPLQEAWVKERLGSPAEDVLLRDLRLLLKDGRQLHGAEAYRYVMRRIWWVYPLYLLSITPVLRRVFDWGYRSVADNRYHLSSTCQVPATSVDGPQHRADVRRGSR